MYHLRDVTLSFTKRKWQTYECPVRKTPSLNREGWGGSPVWVSSLGLQFGSLVGGFNPSPQPPAIKQVTPHGEVFLFVETPL